MKIVLAVYHRMVCDLLRVVAEGEFGHQVVAAVADGPEAVEAVARLSPDLLLLDLQLPGLDNLRIVEVIRGGSRPTRIVVLSSWCDPYTVYCIERLGVQGFLDKRGTTLDALRAALAAVGAGRTHFSAAFWREKAARNADSCAFDKVLSDREQTVLALIGELLTDGQIGQRLEISPHTVEKHCANIRRKLGLGARGELARYAAEHGFRSFLVPRR